MATENEPLKMYLLLKRGISLAILVYRRVNKKQVQQPLAKEHEAKSEVDGFSADDLQERTFGQSALNGFFWCMNNSPKKPVLYRSK